MRAWRVRGASLLVCLWLLPTVTHAEGGPICSALGREAVEVHDSDPGTDVYLGSGDKWLTEDLRKRYPSLPPAHSAAALRFQVQRIRASLQASSVFSSASGKLLQARMLDELTLIGDALATLEPSRPVSLDQLKNLYALARLDQTTSFAEDCSGTHYTTNSLFFQDAAASEQVVLRAAPETTAGVPELQVPVAAQPISFVSIAEASEFRAALAAVRALLDQPLLRAVEHAAARLTQISRSWSNYLEHGFSQYPWEAAINSLGTLSWDTAPGSQWIVLHPELAFVVDARRPKDASGAPALLVHALGFAGYGATRSWFLGVSATGAVTTRTSLGFGAGGTLHFGHSQLYSALPHISLSVLVFPSHAGRVFPFVGLSADLWRLVSDSGESIFKSKLLQ